MKPDTQKLLLLTNCSYDEYNKVLPEIKKRLLGMLAGTDRVKTFEKVLEEELPLTTARRAYRTAILVAMGEEKVYREFQTKEDIKNGRK